MHSCSRLLSQDRMFTFPKHTHRVFTAALLMNRRHRTGNTQGSANRRRDALRRSQAAEGAQWWREDAHPHGRLDVRTLTAQEAGLWGVHRTSPLYGLRGQATLTAGHGRAVTSRAGRRGARHGRGRGSTFWGLGRLSRSNRTGAGEHGTHSPAPSKRMHFIVCTLYLLTKKGEKPGAPPLGPAKEGGAVCWNPLEKSRAGGSGRSRFL